MDNNLQSRKLVRPRLNQPKASGDSSAPRPTRKKQVPPERTNAENFYYLKQMNNRTPMKVILTDGEILEGNIEWYDKYCIKVNRDAEPNLLVMKNSIKYMYKRDEEDEDSQSEEFDIEISGEEEDY
jgi:sRNA-binding regulator protein Hfq